MAYEATITVPHERVHLGSAGGRIAVGGVFLAVVGFVVALLIGTRTDGMDASRAELLHTHFWHAYLWAFSFFLAITLGSLFFVMMTHLARAGWSVLVRRVAEAISANTLLIGVLFLPIVYLAATQKLDILYHWAHPGIQEHDRILKGKEPYLNLTFWFVRLVGFIVVWSFLAFFMRGNSIAQDADGDVARSKRMEKVAAPGLLFFGFSLTFAAFDLLMTLNPHWFSTMWGVYYFATCALSFFSALVLLLLALQKRGLLGPLVNAEHFHDLGKWMFAFTFFWGYIAFSQYMLIWYANIPEETQFYIPRQIGPWGALSILLVIAHLVIPFPGLLSRHVKRKMPVLAFWAVWSLLACLLDLFYIVMPNTFINKIPEVVGEPHAGLQEALPKLVHSSTGVGGPGIYGLAAEHQDFWPTVNFAVHDPKAWVVTVAMFLGMAGLYVASTMFFLKRASLVPLKDPRLPESIAHENA